MHLSINGSFSISSSTTEWLIVEHDSNVNDGKMWIRTIYLWKLSSPFPMFRIQGNSWTGNDDWPPFKCCVLHILSILVYKIYFHLCLLVCLFFFLFSSAAVLSRRFFLLLLILCHLAWLALQASASNLAALSIPVLLTAPPKQSHCLKLNKLKIMIGNHLLCWNSMYSS